MPMVIEYNHERVKIVFRIFQVIAENLTERSLTFFAAQ